MRGKTWAPDNGSCTGLARGEVNEAAANRGTAMTIAAQEGHTALVRELASQGGHVEAKHLRFS
jgi:hypothetical protein